MEKKCLNCSSPFSPSRPHLLQKAKFCSCSCAGKWAWCNGVRKGYKHSEDAKKKIGKGNSGEKNGHWKGGKHLQKDGYARVRKNGKVYREHRFIMEQFLGRKLLLTETVHHLNGIRNDNRIENLELWTKPPTRGIRAKEALKYAREIIALYADIEDKL